MRNVIPERIAALGLLILLSLTILFHMLIIVGVIPFAIVWGGRLQDDAQMIFFEVISLVINAAMVGVVRMRMGWSAWNANPLFIKVALWIMVMLFALNTVGNLFSNNELERTIFTPLTFVLVILSFRLAMDVKK